MSGTWIVDLGVTLREGADADDVIHAALVRLAELSPSSSQVGNRIVFRLTVGAPSVGDAISRVQKVWGDTTPPDPSGETDVLEASVFAVISESEGARVIDEVGHMALLGVAELAKLLEVSKPRARQVAGRQDFPQPVSLLAATPVWQESAVREFVVRRRSKDNVRPVARTHARSRS